MCRILRLAVATLLFLAPWIPPETAMAKRGQEQTLYSFAGGSDGNEPAGVIRDADGNLYGVTIEGGDLSCNRGFGCGTIFKLAPDGTKTTLHMFHGGNDGVQPLGKLMRDSTGNLLGTTEYGGSHNFGMVFKVAPSGTLTVLHEFSGGTDGGYPAWVRLISDASGNLFGTTSFGGDLSCSPPEGCGVVFKLAPTGSETVLYAFHGAKDGSAPLGGLHRDIDGNLYGTTAEGGGSQNCGTIFKIDTDGRETVLHRFTGGDGCFPDAPPAIDRSGNLYGTALEGGNTAQPCPDGCGTVYKLSADGTFAVLYAFLGTNDGVYPTGGLQMGSRGNLFGNTNFGGSSNRGTVFRLRSGGRERTLHSFSGVDGISPNRGMAGGKDGYFYGTAGQGGLGFGTVFKVKK